MNVGIGLPATIPGVDGKTVVEWARRGEQRGFSSLGVIDRVVYPNYEPLVALAAAAAVTETVRLATTILIAPPRLNTALLAKQAATVDSLSGGRLTLGVAIGARDDDYEASGAPTEGRGAKLETQIEEMKRIWSGEEMGYAGAIGPTPEQNSRPELIIGGHADPVFARAARLGDGWIMGGGTPDQFADLAGKLDQAWAQQERNGRPRKLALAYYSLGSDAQASADQYLHHYYAWLGEYADQIAASAAISEEMVQSYIAAFEQAGCDELILFPCSTGVEQVDLLADAAGGSVG